MNLPRGLVWITGASSGIGQSSARLLAKHGWTVAVSARNGEALDRLADRSKNIYAYPLDVADPVFRKEVYSRIRKELGPVDILVNNAGFAYRGAVEEIESAELRNLFDTNVFAPIALSKLVLPEMRERREGRIVMVSSVVGRVSFPLNGSYSATKFALEGFSDAMRVELTPWGVKVILVEPGPIASEFSSRARDLSEARMSSDGSPYTPYYRRMLSGGLFSRRIYWGPSTVAEVICHACESQRPRTRYPVHPLAVFLPWLARLLPTPWLDRMFAWRLGLDKPIDWK